MMKLKVLKKFHDKETDQLRNVGDEIEVTDNRGKEILASKMNVAELLEVGEPDAPQTGAEGEGSDGTPKGEQKTENPEETKPAEVQMEQNPEGTEAGGEPAKQVKKTKGKNK